VREQPARQPPGDGPQVQPGATDEDRQTAALRDARQDVGDVGREVDDREADVGIDEVEAVVPDPGAIGGRDLRGPDVEPAVDLPRVGADDLGRAALGDEPFGEAEREPGLAGRGRAGDDEERRVRRQATAPRRAYGPAWSIRT
jgi:hypothetical protein